MPQADEAFLAGSRSFSLALFGPLTESTGLRPRLLGDPAQAQALCAGVSGVLVVEAGPEWLPAIEALRRQAPALRVVAAVGRGQEAIAAPLEALGAEAVAWEGRPGPLLEAAARAVGARRPGVVQPPAAGPGPAAAPRAGPPVAPPVLPPAVQPPPRQVITAAPPPVLQVAAPPTLPLVPAPAAPVLAPAPVQPTALQAATPPPYQAPPPQAAAPAAPPPPAPPAWPSQVPDEEAAESALVRSLRGKLPADAPLAAAAARAVAALSPLERKALGGEAIPFDAAPIYRAAVIRLRTTLALESVPEPPAAVDHDAVEALLGALDEVLAQVNPLAAQATEAQRPELEAVRHALVRVAVDFSEAAHRLGPVAAAAPEAGAAPAATRARRETKLLSVHSGTEPVAAPPRRTNGWLVALAVVGLLVGAYHGWSWISRPAPQPPPTLPGAPANTLAFRNEGGQFLMAFGAPVDPGKLRRFVEQEQQKGNTVREIATGTWIIEPAEAAKDGKTP